MVWVQQEGACSGGLLWFHSLLSLSIKGEKQCVPQGPVEFLLGQEPGGGSLDINIVLVVSPSSGL